MRAYATLIGQFIARRFNKAGLPRQFLISLMHSLLNATGCWGGRAVRAGRDGARLGLGATLAVLGVYLTVGALRDTVTSQPGRAGRDGRRSRTGRLDFTLLRPVDIQFLASVTGGASSICHRDRRAVRCRAGWTPRGRRSGGVPGGVWGRLLALYAVLLPSSAHLLGRASCSRGSSAGCSRWRATGWPVPGWMRLALTGWCRWDHHDGPAQA